MLNAERSLEKARVDAGGNCHLNEPFVYSPPAEARIAILAITWGGKEVRCEAVYKYCYENYGRDKSIS